MWHCCFIFFFFKQKTAYEMRISDWSSDVCSSDLLCGTILAQPPCRTCAQTPRNELLTIAGCTVRPIRLVRRSMILRFCMSGLSRQSCSPSRSEEHTSELQSLMRISYPVFCLKKHKHKHEYTPHIQQTYPPHTH